MKLNEYQNKAMAFAKYASPDYPFLALCEEAGEVSGKLAKYVRKNDCSAAEAIDEANQDVDTTAIELKINLKKELGDILWQLQACCHELGVNLEDVASENLEKLSDRNNRGVIVGEGDNR